MRKMKSDERSLQLLLQNMKAWVDSGSKKPFQHHEWYGRGICEFVSTTGRGLCYIFLDSCKNWKKYSGVSTYPVPAVTATDPQEEYSLSSIKSRASFDYMGMFRDTYGQLRYEMMEFVIWWLGAEGWKRWVYKKLGVML